MQRNWKGWQFQWSERLKYTEQHRGHGQQHRRRARGERGFGGRRENLLHKPEASVFEATRGWHHGGLELHLSQSNIKIIKRWQTKGQWPSQWQIWTSYLKSATSITLVQGDTGGRAPWLGWLTFGMFHHPAWAVGSYNSSQTAGGMANSKFKTMLN